MELNPAKQERLPQLDIFRALAILGVLNVHSTSLAAGGQAVDSPYFYLLNGINIFFRFGTPSFIFLSSFVLFYNYYGRPVTRSLIGNFYRRRLVYILLPYFLASIGYYGLTVTINGGWAQGAGEHLYRFLKALLTGNAYTHLYFVFISIQFYVLFPLVLKLLQTSRTLVRWIIPIGLVIQWGFSIWNKYDLHLVEKGSVALSYFAYYLMGAYIAIHFEDIKRWLLTPWRELPVQHKWVVGLLWSGWLAVAMVHIQLWYEGRHNAQWIDSLWYELAWNIHTMLSALVLFKAAFLIYREAPRAMTAFLTRLGELSFAIYLIHPLLLAVYRRFRYNIPPESFTYVLFIFGGLIVALGGSWLIVQFAFRRIRIAWVGLGSVPRSLAPPPAIKQERGVRMASNDGSKVKVEG